MWDVGGRVWGGHATVTGFLALAPPTTPALPQGREQKDGRPMSKQLGFG